MALYGWQIGVDRCTYLDDGNSQIYAVNLVVPWTDTMVDPLYGPTASTLPSGLLGGTLFRPWAWRDLRWVAFGRRAGVPDFEKIGQVSFDWEHGDDVPLQNDAGIPQAVDRDVDARTAGCAHPFSMAEEDYWGTSPAPGGPPTNVSVVHTMAPMTHWPALVSGRLLKRSGFVRLPAASCAGFELIALVPVFSFDADGVVKAAALDPAAVPVPEPGPNVPLVVRMTYQAVAGEAVPVAILCKVAETADPLTPPVATPGNLVITQSEVSRASLQAIVLSWVSPLALLVDWVAQAYGAPVGSADASALQSLLASDQLFPDVAALPWRGQGIGWERGSGGGTPKGNVIEWFRGNDMTAAQGQALCGLLRAGVDRNAAVQAASAVFAALDARAIPDQPDTATWSVSRRDVWRARRKTWDGLAATQRFAWAPGDKSRFVEEWLSLARALLADDGQRDLLGPWLAKIISAVPGVAASAVGGAWANVATRLSADCGTGMRFTVGMHHLTRARSGLVTPAQWDAILQYVKASTAGTQPIVDATTIGVGALFGSGIASTIGTALGIFIGKRVDAMVQELLHASRPTRPRSFDAGLRLTFESVIPSPEWDQRIRGYAIGLCAGVRTDSASTPWFGDQQRAQWISDADACVKSDTGIAWLRGQDGTPVRMHECVGSTLQDGIRTVSADYDGQPLAVPVARSTALIGPDSANGGNTEVASALHYRWLLESPGGASAAAQRSLELPLLGFGLHYFGTAVAIDNAGGIMAAPGWRIGLARLAPASDMTAPPTPVPFVSSEPPGAPLLISGIDEALLAWSDETRAQAYRAWEGRSHESVATATAGQAAPLSEARRQRVALLTHSQQVGSSPLFRPSAASVRLVYSTPQAHTVFCRRWLSTDQLLLERLEDGASATVLKPMLSDPKFGSGPFTSQWVRGEIDRLRRLERDAKPMQAGYHPAVRRLGVAVWVDGTPGDQPRTWMSDPLPIWSVDATGIAPIEPRPQVRISIVAGTSSANAVDVPADGGTDITVTIGRGHFARIRVYSLMDEAYFSRAGTGARFEQGLEGPGDRWSPSFTGSRAFGYTEHWVEVAPEWTSLAGDLSIDIGATGAPPLAVDSVVRMPVAPGWADWVKGFHAQRHEWHWTGLPVSLPNGDDLSGWMTSLAAVESFREVIDTTLATQFLASSGTPAVQWLTGSDGNGQDRLHRLNLHAGARPARYLAYLARPMLRFRSLVNDGLDQAAASSTPLALERRLITAGKVLRGEADWSQRLPVPPLRWAIPLTSTYAGTPDGGRAVRVSNGVMVVIDAAMRRTDDLVQIGGLGDTLQVEVLETRNAATPEIGVNPLFHPLRGDGALVEGGADASTTAIGVQVGKLFALTFDSGPNPLVAQTGAILTPVGAHGRWIMARIRARRCLLPETEAQAMLQTESPPGAMSPGFSGSWAVAWRQVGDDSVPIDCAIDFDDAPPSALALAIRASPTSPLARLDLALPTLPSSMPSGRRRLLLSWHQGRWAGSTVSWCCQVLLQVRTGDKLDWTNVARNGCFQNSASPLPEGGLGDHAWLLVGGAMNGLQAQRVLLSDYTEPLWVSFIGSFGQGSLGDPAEYELNGDGKRLTLTSPSGAPLPVLRARNPSTLSTTFHLLLVYKQVSDLTRGDATADSGMPIATFEVDDEGQPLAGIGASFKPLALVEGATTLPPLEGDGLHAQLLCLQRISAPSLKETDDLQSAQSFQALMTNLAFPKPGIGSPSANIESTLRITPETFGPLRIRTTG